LNITEYKGEYTMRIFPDYFVLAMSYWYDEDFFVKFGPSTTFIFKPEPHTGCIKGIGFLRVSFDKRNKVFRLPTTLFSIELSGITKCGTEAILAFNIEEYNKQPDEVKRIITDAILENQPFEIGITWQNFMTDTRKVWFSPPPEKPEKPEKGE
jgi:hypothetical protein